MNHELYIARRMTLNGEQKKGSPSLTVALVGIVLAVVVMILSIAIVMGFKGEISGKILPVSCRMYPSAPPKPYLLFLIAGVAQGERS